MTKITESVRSLFKSKTPKVEDTRHTELKQRLEMIATYGPSVFKVIGAASVLFVLYGAINSVYGNLKRGINAASFIGGPLLFYIGHNGHTVSNNFQEIADSLHDHCPKEGMESKHREVFKANLQKGTVGFGFLTDRIIDILTSVYELEKKPKS